MQCPKCSSSHTQKLSVIHEMGTRHFKSRSFGAEGGSWTTGTSISAMAEKTSPPSKKTAPFSWFLLVFMGLCAVMSIVMAIQIGNGASILIALIFMVMCAFPFYRVRRAAHYNAATMPALYRHWEESWLCQQCGTIYHQPE